MDECHVTLYQSSFNAHHVLQLKTGNPLKELNESATQYSYQCIVRTQGEGRQKRRSPLHPPSSRAATYPGQLLGIIIMRWLEFDRPLEGSVKEGGQSISLRPVFQKHQQ